jgi:ATP-dependent DNA helicase RecQ
LYREHEPPRATRRMRRSIAEQTASSGDAGLFEVLRQVRLRIARDRGLPPYVIFHDRTLQEMASRRPATVEELHALYGVGVRKATDFGDAFLDAIRTFGRPE